MEYRVTVTMDTATVKSLRESGSELCVYRAVSGADPATRPVLWAKAPYSTNTEIAWTDSWTAYVSTPPITGGKTVTAGFSTPIAFGQTLDVDAYGLGTVTTGGDPTVISIHNSSNTPYTAGVSCAADAGDPTPFCILPLHGNGLQTVVPVQSVLLHFTDQPLSVGTILDDMATAARMRATYAWTPSYLIDLTPDATGRAVAFNIDTGWTNGDATWARMIPAGTSLTDVLIRQ